MAAPHDENVLAVGLCDDESHTHDTINTMLLAYSEINDIRFNIVHYYSAQELLTADDKLDFLLLDIDMPEMDGIEAAYRLKDREVEYKIVMLTAKEERYKDAFRIGAFRFVSKPIFEKELYSAIDDVREHLTGMEQVTVFRDGVMYRITQRDIVYVEADRSSSLIFTKESEYRSELSLAEWERVLDGRVFFRCHKSFIVNLGKIEKIEKSMAHLVTGDRVEVSRRLRTSLLHAYMEYDTRRR